MPAVASSGVIAAVAINGSLRFEDADQAVVDARAPVRLRSPPTVATTVRRETRDGDD